LDTWERRGSQLVKYLAKDAPAELQMGAISGLSDMDAPPVAVRLIAGLEGFTPANRALALDALLRTDARTAALLDALERGRVDKGLVDDVHRTVLRALPNPTLRARALK